MVVLDGLPGPWFGRWSWPRVAPVFTLAVYTFTQTGRGGTSAGGGSGTSRGGGGGTSNSRVGTSSHSSNPSTSNETISASPFLPSQYPTNSQSPPQPQQQAAQYHQQHPLYQPPPAAYQLPQHQQPPHQQPQPSYQLPQHQQQPYQISPHQALPFIPEHQPPPPPEDPDPDPPNHQEYQQLLDDLLVLPGRQHIPLLSQFPIIDVETM
ncbi:PREDICTED: early nodulin-75-like [Camelina sativa]|uniref:Early nodulin-75-like n=1 Tax=Camelina sativa TaxID=90675 RepID=A0ABM1RKV0_CAMSA|nr:PREDICTED: early nodulin-75-like [Camelina sativa]